MKPAILVLAALAIAAPLPVSAIEHRNAASGSARERERSLTGEHRVDAANRGAIRDAMSGGFVNAAQVFTYSEGALYRLIAAPERVSDIALQPGEAIVAVAAGDTARWTVGDTTSGSGADRRVHVLVKPYTAGLSTNLIITTDRRTYHLQLESTATTATTAISWTYPADDMLAIEREQSLAAGAAPVAQGVDLERLRFGYAISGDKPGWRPRHAFDDGQRTYIEFPPDIAQHEAPPLFLVGRDGKAELVNYRMSGRYYVVDRLFDVAELRLGGKKQKVVRISRKGRR